MSLFEHNSFNVPKGAAERMIREKIQSQRSTKVPGIDFESMSKPQEDMKPPEFQRPAKTNTLTGEE